MQLLIATDVAARGIDVNDLTHVLHHTVPDQLESYTHRSGRTGRAGRKGISLAFVNAREERRIKDLERKLNITFEKIEVPALEELRSKRINNWAQLIVNTKVDKDAEAILQSLHGQFEHLSKEDILKRLITTQLDHLMIQKDTGSDLNETGAGTPKKRGKSGFNRYFINVGTIDGVTKPDLVHFLADVSNVDRKFIGEITLQKNCAFFDVDETKDKGFGQKFSGIEVEGREIRVNRDEEDGKRTRTQSTEKQIGRQKNNRPNRDRVRSRARRRY